MHPAVSIIVVLMLFSIIVMMLYHLKWIEIPIFKKDAKKAADNKKDKDSESEAEDSEVNK